MYIDKGQMKPKIPSRMDGLYTQATWETRHNEYEQNKKNITQNTTTMSNTDPTKTESESKWSWNVTYLIVPIFPLSTIVF